MDNMLAHNMTNANPVLNQYNTTNDTAKTSEIANAVLNRYGRLSQLSDMTDIQLLIVVNILNKCN